jgi:hypothetical protein
MCRTLQTGPETQGTAIVGPRAKVGIPIGAHTRPMTWISPERHEGHDVWIPCGTCWGQRTVFTTSAEHGGLTPGACPGCLGVGERLSDGGHVPSTAS